MLKIQVVYTMLMFVCSVNAFLFMWAKPVHRSAMHVGSCTVWNMVFNQMDKCPLTRQLEVETTPSTHSSVKQGQGSMFQEPSLWT